MTNLNIDIIKEVANIASGNAISALADLTDKKLDIYIPNISDIDLRDIPMLMGDEEDIIVAIQQDILTGFKGSILFAIDEISFKKLLFTIKSKYDECEYECFENINILNLNEMESSIVKEIGNILTGSYLSAIATLIGSEVNPSVPKVAIDMAGTILCDSVIKSNQIENNRLFVINTELYLEESRVNSQIFLLPEENEIEKLVKKIRTKYNLNG
ncbi:MAG: chemotaxis protein CheC [Romboutsia sp.]|nr:chemotaxis protein CheC [Romboutsia sp.]